MSLSPDRAAAEPADWSPVADWPAPAPPPSAGTITAQIRRFIYVTNRIAALKAELKTLEREKGELSDTVIDTMVEQEMDSPPGVDGMTSYLTPVYHVEKNINPDTGETYTSADVLDALRDAHLEAMISEGYNGSQMRSLMREFADNDQSPPDALVRVFTLVKRRELRVTQMAVGKRKASPLVE